MENNNEIIENSEEVMETATEEIVKAASSNSSFSTATKFLITLLTRIMKKFQMTMLQKNKHRNEF